MDSAAASTFKFNQCKTQKDINSFMKKTEVSAKSVSRTVTKTIQVEEQDHYEVTLKLTKQDAIAVATLCRHIGGFAESSARGVFDSLNWSLCKVGIEPPAVTYHKEHGYCPVYPSNYPIENPNKVSIFFKSYVGGSE